DHKDGKDDDPMHGVDMTPWLYVRTFLLMVVLGWTVQLSGRIVECVMGERMLMVNPGAPPWSRVGQWYGWEFGPITSKHYAHVTPMQGHFNYQHGWGPQGQQEIWSSDMFGFHPEADMWWAEPLPEEGEELPAQLTLDSLVGAAGYGENHWRNWAKYVEDGSGEPFQFHSQEAWDEAVAEVRGGGHRRLRGEEAVIKVQRPVVPVPVQWSRLLDRSCSRAARAAAQPGRLWRSRPRASEASCPRRSPRGVRRAPPRASPSRASSSTAWPRACLGRRRPSASSPARGRSRPAPWRTTWAEAPAARSWTSPRCRSGSTRTCG
ncbi:unnamed protein product, partial [Prorocentrum cordatum]